ncbi:MAG: flagellar export protein FliJ [Lachnospiraceae bacterium]
MSKFKYRMQSILDIKNKMETQAKMDYAAARMYLNEEEERLEGLRQRKESYESEARRLLLDNLKVREIIDTQTAILRMDDYIAEQIKQVKKAEEKLEEARVKLTEVMKERKTHEKLREKAFDVFLQEEKASESKEIDQLTSYRYGQKIKE